MFTKIVVLIMSLVVTLTTTFGLNFIAPAEEAEDVKNVIILIGDGADLSYKFLSEKGLDVRTFSEIFKFQHASGVAITAYRHYNKGEKFISAAELVPSYLRLSQAERELKKSGVDKK